MDTFAGLIEAWKVVPDARIADLVLLQGRQEDAVQAALDLLDERGSSTRLAEHVEALLELEPDPRIGHRLERMLRKVPYTSNGARPVLERIFRVVHQISRVDPRFVGFIETVEEDWDVRPLQRAWMFETFAPVQEQIDARWPVIPRIDSLEVSVSAEVVDELDALWAAVYAGGHALEPRRVLMDALLERGDARGAYLALALGGDDTPPADPTPWLGEVADLVEVETWKNGFPWSGTLKVGQPKQLKRLAASPVLRTLGELVATPDKHGLLWVPLLERVCDTLVDLTLEGPQVVEAMAQVSLTSLERLSCPRVLGWNVLESLGRVELPALQHLRVPYGEPLVFLRARWFSQLETLSCRAGVRVLPGMMHALSEHPTLQLLKGIRFELVRGEDRRLSVLRIGGLERHTSDDDIRYGTEVVSPALDALPAHLFTVIEAEDAPWLPAANALAARMKDAPGEQGRVLYQPELLGGGGRLLASQNGEVFELDPGTGAVLGTRPLGFQRALAVDGSEVASLGAQTVWWDRWTQPGGGHSLDLHGSRLLVVGEKTRVYDTSGAEVCVYGPRIRQASLSPAGDRAVVTSFDKPLRILSLSNGRTRKLKSSTRGFSAVWTQDGKIWLSTLDDVLQVLSDQGEVLFERAFEHCMLQRWERGVLATDPTAKRVQVLNAEGATVLDVPGRLAAATTGGLWVFGPDKPLTRVDWPG